MYEWSAENTDYLDRSCGSIILSERGGDTPAYIYIGTDNEKVRKIQCFRLSRSDSLPRTEQNRA